MSFSKDDVFYVPGGRSSDAEIVLKGLARNFHRELIVAMAIDSWLINASFTKTKAVSVFRTSIGGTQNAGYVGGTKHTNMVQDWKCQPASGPCVDNSNTCPEPQLREVIKCPPDDCGAEQVGSPLSHVLNPMPCAVTPMQICEDRYCSSGK